MGQKTVILKKLHAFWKKVEKDFPLQTMILFGSRAKGKPHRYSDVDLILVSPQFKKLDFVKRGARMYDYWNIDYPVDFLCYTSKEFEKKKKEIGVVQQAVKEGIEIR